MKKYRPLLGQQWIRVFVIRNRSSFHFLLFSLLLLDEDFFYLCRLSFFASLFFLSLIFVIYSKLSSLKRSPLRYFLILTMSSFFLSFLFSLCFLFFILPFNKINSIYRPFLNSYTLRFSCFFFLRIFYLFRPRSFLNQFSIFTHLFVHFSC